MVDVQFADVFFILLVCVVTYGILHLVNRSKPKASGKSSNPKSGSPAENREKLLEDD